jgi:hypothetical protein
VSHSIGPPPASGAVDPLPPLLLPEPLPPVMPPELPLLPELVPLGPELLPLGAPLEPLLDPLPEPLLEPLLDPLELPDPLPDPLLDPVPASAGSSTIWSYRMDVNVSPSYVMFTVEPLQVTVLSNSCAYGGDVLHPGSSKNSASCPGVTHFSKITM